MGSEAFYVDQRLGSVCTINGKDAYSLFNADLKEMTPVAGSIAADFSKALGIVNGLYVTHYVLETGGIEVIFYVGGVNKEYCDINTSNLIAECQHCVIKTNESRFEHVAVLTAYNVVETGVDFYNEVTLTFNTIKRFPMVSHTFDGTGGVFRNVGSVASGARVTVTPKVALETFTINGVTISNLDAGLPFVIDGLVGEIKCNGINRFLDTDLIDFPKVTPGTNVVEVSSADAVVEVSYYPVFVV